MSGFLLKNLFRWMVMCIALFVAAHIPILGINYDSPSDLFLAGFILVLVNTFIRPVLMVVSLPLIIFSFGIVLLVINALMLMLVGWLLPGFHVAGFWSAFVGALVVSFVSIFLGGHWRWKKKIIHAHPTSQRLHKLPGEGEVIDI